MSSNSNFFVGTKIKEEESFILKIREQREKKGWSQLELAEKSGVPQPTLSGIERGERKYPTYENIKKIAIALEIDIKELDEDFISLG
ncbi:helix-turn-helix domain-containing protein [Paenibacillus humicola]|uniref:helix-turn-helix domain-containing protein n=1 Tax=Paenibacillus humicola TaxID=3110540 RepID=UPI00237B4B9C|nr:helix-turn-helix transcriptional regulator [Paenibacillus humicola]